MHDDYQSHLKKNEKYLKNKILVIMIGLCSKLGIIILGCFTKRAQLVMFVCKQLVVMVHKLSTTSSGIKEPEGL